MARERRGVDVWASAVATAVSVAVLAAIVLGSRGLRDFDAALVGYATATVFLAFGVTYRYVVWLQSPPARHWFRRGWRSFLSFRNFRRSPSQVPRAVVGNLGFQRFIAARGAGRWLAHQAVFWGVVLATLVTFPLTFGWFRFETRSATSTDYDAFVAGFELGAFDATSWFGWIVFHVLDLAAVLVIAGVAYFLWRRFRDRELAVLQRLGHDLTPLVALVVISATGLLLTFSSLALDGRYYDFLAILHMAAVVLTLLYIPFGKFFHVIQRPASLGVQVAKQAALDRDGPARCRRCGDPLETAEFLGDLQETMGELGLGFEGWTETCPRCKRLTRGAAYLEHVKDGFR
ncbi:MAG TPA: MFS transporter [Acidimicrobiia bacterium]